MNNRLSPSIDFHVRLSCVIGHWISFSSVTRLLDQTFANICLYVIFYDWIGLDWIRSVSHQFSATYYVAAAMHEPPAERSTFPPTTLQPPTSASSVLTFPLSLFLSFAGSHSNRCETRHRALCQRGRTSFYHVQTDA